LADGAGRPTTIYTTDGGGDSSFSDASTVTGEPDKGSPEKGTQPILFGTAFALAKIHSYSIALG